MPRSAEPPAELAATAPQKRVPYLRLLEPLPPGTPPGKGPKIGLDRAVTIAGRRKNAQLYLKSSTVSNAHALFVNTGGRLFVRDLASRNGTFVGNSRVAERRLRDGEEVRLGRFKFVVVDKRPDPGEDPPGPPVTVVIAGNGGQANGEHDIPEDARVQLVGQREVADVSLHHPDVTRAHLALVRLDGVEGLGWAAFDLGGKGTTLDLRPIRRAAVGEGATLGVGPFELRLRPDPNRHPPAPEAYDVDAAHDEADAEPAVATFDADPGLSSAFSGHTAADSGAWLDDDIADEAPVEADAPASEPAAEADAFDVAAPVANAGDDLSLVTSDDEPPKATAAEETAVATDLDGTEARSPDIAGDDEGDALALAAVEEPEAVTRHDPDASSDVEDDAAALSALEEPTSVDDTEAPVATAGDDEHDAIALAEEDASAPDLADDASADAEREGLSDAASVDEDDAFALAALDEPTDDAAVTDADETPAAALPLDASADSTEQAEADAELESLAIAPRDADDAETEATAAEADEPPVDALTTSDDAAETVGAADELAASSPDEAEVEATADDESSAEPAAPLAVANEDDDVALPLAPQADADATEERPPFDVAEEPTLAAADDAEEPSLGLDAVDFADEPDEAAEDGPSFDLSNLDFDKVDADAAEAVTTSREPEQSPEPEPPSLADDAGAPSVEAEIEPEPEVNAERPSFAADTDPSGDDSKAEPEAHAEPEPNAEADKPSLTADAPAPRGDSAISPPRRKGTRRRGEPRRRPAVPPETVASLVATTPPPAPEPEAATDAAAAEPVTTEPADDVVASDEVAPVAADGLAAPSPADQDEPLSLADDEVVPSPSAFGELASPEAAAIEDESTFPSTATDEATSAADGASVDDIVPSPASPAEVMSQAAVEAADDDDAVPSPAAFEEQATDEFNLADEPAANAEAITSVEAAAGEGAAPDDDDAQLDKVAPSASPDDVEAGATAADTPAPADEATDGPAADEAAPPPAAPPPAVTPTPLWQADWESLEQGQPASHFGAATPLPPAAEPPPSRRPAGPSGPRRPRPHRPTRVGFGGRPDAPRHPDSPHGPFSSQAIDYARDGADADATPEPAADASASQEGPLDPSFVIPETSGLVGMGPDLDIPPPTPEVDDATPTDEATPAAEPGGFLRAVRDGVGGSDNGTHASNGESADDEAGTPTDGFGSGGFGTSAATGSGVATLSRPPRGIGVTPRRRPSVPPRPRRLPRVEPAFEADLMGELRDRGRFLGLDRRGRIVLAILAMLALIAASVAAVQLLGAPSAIISVEVEHELPDGMAASTRADLLAARTLQVDDPDVRAEAVAILGRQSPSVDAGWLGDPADEQTNARFVGDPVNRLLISREADDEDATRARLLALGSALAELDETARAEARAIDQNAADRSGRRISVDAQADEVERELQQLRAEQAAADADPAAGGDVDQARQRLAAVSARSAEQRVRADELRKQLETLQNAGPDTAGDAAPDPVVAELTARANDLAARAASDGGAADELAGVERELELRRAELDGERQRAMQDLRRRVAVALAAAASDDDEAAAAREEVARLEARQAAESDRQARIALLTERRDDLDARLAELRTETEAENERQANLIYALPPEPSDLDRKPGVDNRPTTMLWAVLASFSIGLLGLYLAARP